MSSPDYPCAKWSWKTAVLFVCTGLLVLLTIGWIHDWLGAAELTRAVRDATADGKPFTLEQMIAARKIWPEDRNGAQVLMNMSARLEALGKDAGEKTLPIDWRRPLGERWSLREQQMVRGFLEAYAAESTALYKLRDYEGGNFPLVQTPNPLDMKYPHYAWVRACVRLMDLQAVDRAMNGDTSQLAEDIDIMLRLANLVLDDPYTVAVLVRTACQTEAINTVQRSCAVAPLAPETIAHLQDLLNTCDDRGQRIEFGMRSERAQSIAIIDLLRGQDKNRRIPGWQGLVLRDEAKMIDVFERDVIAVQSPAPLQQLLLAQAGSTQTTRSMTFLGDFVPSLSRFVVLCLRTTTEVRCARLGLAAERYRLAKGCWPARIDELVPEYIDAVPADPFKPDERIKMAWRTDRLVFYAVDENGKDDGGDLELRPNSEPPFLDWGFTLLDPSVRNCPAPPDEPQTQPASQPATNAQ